MDSALLEKTAGIAPATSTPDVSGLFDLSARAEASRDLPAGMDSGDCTSDGCTDSCVNC